MTANSARGIDSSNTGNARWQPFRRRRKYLRSGDRECEWHQQNPVYRGHHSEQDALIPRKLILERFALPNRAGTGWGHNQQLYATAPYALTEDPGYQSQLEHQ